MNVAPLLVTPTSNHHEIAQRSFDEFAAAYSTTSRVGAGTPGVIDTAVTHVAKGVELLGQAYAAIPAGAYNPGNQTLTVSWAADAVAQLRSGFPGQALDTLDAILERVSNDFDLN